jgi:hypothetical protein
MVCLTAAHYPQALTLAEDLSMRPLVAHCRRGRDRLYHQTSRAAPARTALATAIVLYRAMDMTFWLPQAEAVLTQVEGQEICFVLRARHETCHITPEGVLSLQSSGWRRKGERWQTL